MNEHLSGKLAAIRANPGCNEFILADAKDADMAWGIEAPGISSIASSRVHRRSMPEFRDLIREIVSQELVDIMLASTSTMSRLAHSERLFDGSRVTPAVRVNDTTDVWLPRGGDYRAQPSHPFATSEICEAQFGASRRGAETPTVNLGLYSVTLNNCLDADLRTLEAFRSFRLTAARQGFRYFLEIFPPNVADAVPAEHLSGFVNDHICRMLAGVPYDARPEFLKIAYMGPAALEELVAYEPTMIVGVLGGSSGTTYDAFKLLEDAKKYGARAALFGRKIKEAEHPLAFIACLRAVADGLVSAEDAVRDYHGALEKDRINRRRSLADDMELTTPELSYARN